MVRRVHLILWGCWWRLFMKSAAAFWLPPPTLPPFRGGGPLGFGRDGIPPPRSQGGGGSSSSSPDDPRVFSIFTRNAALNDTELEHQRRRRHRLNTPTHFPRGGSSSPPRTLKKDSSDPLKSTASFWSRTVQGAISTATQPFTSIKNAFTERFKSPEQKQEEELMQVLRTTSIRRITVPNSTVLPAEVLRVAAKQSNFLGQPLRNDRVDHFAKIVKSWYNRQGYLLHAVTGATLVPESATAEIQVWEPTVAPAAVAITGYQERILDPHTGEALSLRQFRDKHPKTTRDEVNTTWVPTAARTRPQKVAAALQLVPGRPFRWSEERWRKVRTSGIFARVLEASPARLPDGTIQLQILASEAPSRRLEYGLSKSLYTGAWEGELEFEHGNVLGGGETLGFSMRRGTGEAQPSFRLQFADERFGLERGYAVQTFREYISDKKKSTAKDKKNQKDASVTAVDEEGGEDEGVQSTLDYLSDRTGVSFRLRNPLPPKRVANSIASVALERASTTGGLHEDIVSTTWGVGPLVRDLPFGTRSDVDVSITSGVRLTPSDDKDNVRSRLLPYVAVTSTTKQAVPLSTGPTVGSPSRRPIVLALRHTLTTATSTLPKHEANAQGTASSIRGLNVEGPVYSALQGTTEVRFPVTLPLKQIQQDASVILFGDWLLAKRDYSSHFFRHTSVGIGLRKSLQGIPIKYDISYSSQGKVKTSLGLGRDFDVQ